MDNVHPRYHFNAARDADESPPTVEDNKRQAHLTSCDVLNPFPNDYEPISCSWISYRHTSINRIL